MRVNLFVLFLLLTALQARAQNETITLADPTIFYENGTYYLYGTGSPNCFPVYTSPDLKSWSRHAKNALQKGNSYGTSGFWAPQIFKHNNKYYMAYTANEHIAIAESDSPAGPFVQSAPKDITLSGKHIDPFIFKDNNGELYLYFVRLQAGNRIYAARMKNDLSDIDSTTIKECINAENGWENTANTKWPVSEGPTVTKIGSLYYMFYSANDFRNIDYAVGYATSTSPLGPFTKYNGNPILSRKNTQQNGSGHGDVLVAKDGKWYYVFHTHNSGNKVAPRKTAIMQLSVSKNDLKKIAVVPNTFYYLESINNGQ